MKDVADFTGEIFTTGALADSARSGGAFNFEEVASDGVEEERLSDCEADGTDFGMGAD